MIAALWGAVACGAPATTPAAPAPPSTPAPATPSPPALPSPPATPPLVSLAALPPPSNARIAPPGTFHRGEAPAKKGKRALALCGDTLVSTTVRSQRVRDDVTDTDDAQAVRVACDAAWIVVGYAGLRPGPAQNLVDANGAATLGTTRVARSADHQQVIASVAGRDVVLVAGGAEDVVDAIFVGDLSGDGAVDVVVRASGDNHERHFLFVSQATGGLTLAAWHETTGC